MNPTQELLTEALDAGMREQAERLQLPPIRWWLRRRETVHGGETIITGQVSRGDYAEDEVDNVLHAWVAHLALEQVAHLEGDTASYRGTVDGIPVEVWGVIDDEAWEAAIAERIERYRAERQGT